MTKTPEEKAREYAKQYQDLPIVSQYQKNRRYMFKSSYDGFLSGYHSRDEEVKELREALEGTISLICQGTEYEVGIKRYVDLIAKSEQLLK